ncbi:MAG: hypothetical protein M3O01_01365 [Pseudomonadota bacterium]|nr:hypothetical protein [Pseudomonadota bacterium]
MSLSTFGFEQEPVQERRSSRAAAQSVAAPSATAAVADAKSLRDRPSPRDNALSALALAWLAEFGPASRPDHLAARYPRIANRLALGWRDPVLTALILDSLLIDRRGGRKGFPADVAGELTRLRVLVSERAKAVAGANGKV